MAQGTSGPTVSDSLPATGDNRGYINLWLEDIINRVAPSQQSPVFEPVVSAATGGDVYIGDGVYAGDLNQVPGTGSAPVDWNGSGSGSDSGSGSPYMNPYHSAGDYDPYNDQVTPQLEPLIGPALGDGYFATGS